MDGAAVDRAGFDPIKPDVAAIAEPGDTADVVAWLGDAFAKGEGQGFRLGSGSAFQDPTRPIASAGRASPGPPNPTTSEENTTALKSHLPIPNAACRSEQTNKLHSNHKG